MKTIEVRKFITTIWCLFVALFFSCSSLFVIGLVNNTGGYPNKEVEAAEINISNLEELKQFADNVNAGNLKEYNIVYLKSDIDCKGETIAIGTRDNPFTGYFDGGYNTISNFKITYIKDYDPTSDFNTDVGGLFRVVNGAMIFALRVYNFSASGQPSYQLSNVGGLIGAAIGSCHIYESIVDTFSCSNSYIKTVSGIIASGSATIQDCLVKNVTTSNEFYAFGPGAWSNNSKKSSDISSVVCYGCSSIKGMVSNGVNNIAHKLSDYYTYDTGDGFEGLSDIGVSKDDIWYYCSDYSYWPMLTGYMDWKDVFISVNDATLGSVSPTSFEIPSDANLTFSSNTFTIMIYGNYVVATPKNAQGRVVWTCDSATSYTANFQKITFYLEFPKLLGVDPICTSGSFVESTKKLQLSGSETVEVGCKYENNKTIVYYKIGNCRVEYHLDLKYTMLGNSDYGSFLYGDDGGYTSLGITEMPTRYTSMKDGFTYLLQNINPTLKSYGTEFG